MFSHPFWHYLVAFLKLAVTVLVLYGLWDDFRYRRQREKDEAEDRDLDPQPDDESE